MLQTPISTPNIDMSREAAVKWLIVAFLVFVAFVALMFSRRLIQPMDNVLTQQQCTTHGRDVLSREALESEASNRFSLIDRTDGHCIFGPVVEFDEDGEVIEPEPVAGAADDGVVGSDTVGAADPAVEAEDEVEERLQVSLADIETSGFYRAMKWLFIALQLGAASAAVRLIGDPLLDRFVRKPATSA